MATKSKRTKPRLLPVDVHALAARVIATEQRANELEARAGRIEGRMVRLEVAVNPIMPPPRCNIVGCTNPPGIGYMPTCALNCPRKGR